MFPNVLTCWFYFSLGDDPNSNIYVDIQLSEWIFFLSSFGVPVGMKILWKYSFFCLRNIFFFVCFDLVRFPFDFVDSTLLSSSCMLCNNVVFAVFWLWPHIRTAVGNMIIITMSYRYMSQLFVCQLWKRAKAALHKIDKEKLKLKQEYTRRGRGERYKKDFQARTWIKHFDVFILMLSNDSQSPSSYVNVIYVLLSFFLLSAMESKFLLLPYSIMMSMCVIKPNLFTTMAMTTWTHTHKHLGAPYEAFNECTMKKRKGKNNKRKKTISRPLKKINKIIKCFMNSFGSRCSVCFPQ